MKQPYLYYITWGEGGSPTPSILPKELQACEYLETDGDSYIITNIFPTDIYETICKVEGITMNSVQTCSIFGNRRSNGNVQYNCFKPQSLNSLRVDCGTQGVQNIVVNVGRFIIDFNQRVGNTRNTIVKTFDDTSTIATSTNYSTSLNSDYKFTIFGYNNGGTISKAAPGLKMYYLTMKDNTTNDILHQFQPCYVKNNQAYPDTKGIQCFAGTPGMFDIITNEFYTNDSAGTFSVGPDIIL